MRGKLTIMVILGLGLLAAGAAWWHHRARTDQVLQLWGGRTARLIRSSKQVELFRLAAADSAAKERQTDSAAPTPIARGLQAIDQQDISRAPGLLHARQALVQDASYDWTAVGETPRAWQYALRFASGQQSLTLLFDLEQGIVMEPASGRLASIQPIQGGLELFFQEQLSGHASSVGR